jgi:HEAT repeat protein
VSGSPSANIGRLISQFATAEYFWQQTEIARELIATGDRSVIVAIQPYLETNDRRRRCNAAFVLAGLGDERGTVILISELEDMEPGSRILEDGRNTGPQSLASRGISQVRSDRYFAALLLGELRERAAVPALIAATRDQSINYRVAISLGEIGDASAIPALREMAAAFPAERVFAGYGLAALDAPDGFDTLRDVTLSDQQWVQRRYAVELLGKTMDRRAVPILLRALKDEHPNVRVSTVRSLAEIGDPAALPALRVALGDGEATEVNAPTTVAAEAEKAIAAMNRSASSEVRELNGETHGRLLAEPRPTESRRLCCNKRA